MSNESLDELISLYRQGAREASSAQADERILQLAAHSGSRQRTAVAWRWLGAVAAVMVLWLTIHAVMPHPPAIVTATVVTGRIAPGATEDALRFGLLQMDITPAPTPVAQYLIDEAHPSP